MASDTREGRRALREADPHAFGPGKIHIIDGDDASRTYCGQQLGAFPGHATNATEATCKTCRNCEVRRAKRKAEQAKYEATQAQRREEQRSRYEAASRPQPRWLALRYAGFCLTCDADLAADTIALWQQGVGVWCQTCVQAEIARQHAAEAPAAGPAAAEVRAFAESLDDTAPATAGTPAPAAEKGTLVDVVNLADWRARKTDGGGTPEGAA